LEGRGALYHLENSENCCFEQPERDDEL